MSSRRPSDGPAGYGDAFAEVYDEWYADVSDVDATVAAVHRWAGRGRVLELGVGTGRLALPLAAMGSAVVGVDASMAMLARCAAKRTSESLFLVCGDMAAPPCGGTFAVVFVAFNTFFNLDTPAAQRRCLARVADLLEAQGSLFVEAFVPTVEPAEREFSEQARDDGAGGRILTTVVRDPDTQTVSGVHVHSPADGPVRRRPWSIRYVRPDQLDALARDAGLVLADRWESWNETPFQLDDSAQHVSRYTLA